MGKVFTVLVVSSLIASVAIAASPRWNMPLVARTLYVRALEARKYAHVASEYAREAVAERNAETRRRAAREAGDARTTKASPAPEPTPTRISVPTYDEIPRTESRAVRPGSSTALRARRIDATIHPPLVRAKEAVAALPSHLPAPTSPFVIGLLGVSVVVMAFAVGGVGPQRLAVGLAPLLLLGLTSFHPVTEPPAKRIAAPRDVVHRGRSWADRYQRREQPPVYEQQIVQAPMEIPTVPDIPSYDQIVVVPVTPDMQMDEMQRRMTERMREWDYRREMISRQRARARQEALERRLHEQICQIAREQALEESC